MIDCIHTDLSLNVDTGVYRCADCDYRISVTIDSEKPPPPREVPASVTGFIQVEHEITVEFGFTEGKDWLHHARVALESKAQELGGEDRCGNVTGAVLYDSGYDVSLR